MTICSDLPLKTSTFYGREEELLHIRQALDPSKAGRKSVVLSGISGSGKTQLALQHIEQEMKSYSAIVWVNAFTKEHADQSLTETAVRMETSWPKDIPVIRSEHQKDSLSYVLSRLRTTIYRNWLLIIDSADDTNYVTKYFPVCNHGSVLVTTTRNVGASRLGLSNSIHVGGLDKQRSWTRLKQISEREDTDEQG